MSIGSYLDVFCLINSLFFLSVVLLSEFRHRYWAYVEHHLDNGARKSPIGPDHIYWASNFLAVHCFLSSINSMGIGCSYEPDHLPTVGQDFPADIEFNQLPIYT
jgi:hypothetical protein